jgi:integrase/recombinase XerC
VQTDLTPVIDTLPALVTSFLDHLRFERGLAANTLAAYKGDLALFQTVLASIFGPDKAVGAPGDITTEDIRSCVGELSRQRRSPASINRFIAAVRGLFAYGRRYDYVAVDSAAGVKTVKLPKRMPNFMTPAEVAALCSAPATTALLWPKRDSALFAMLYSSGCRVSELSGLTLDDLAPDYRSAIVLGKGSKDRQVFFANDAVAALTAWLSERLSYLTAYYHDHGLPPGIAAPEKQGSLFVNRKGRPLTPRGIRFILGTYTSDPSVNLEISPHTFRHTFATTLLNNGADIRSVQEMLGHASVSTTQRYTHVTREHLKTVYQNAHPHGGI